MGIQCTRLKRTHALDLWQLPQDWLTDPLTDELEREFYRRCPPEKRPAPWRVSQPDLQARPSSVVSTSSATVEDKKRAPKDKTDPHEKQAIHDQGDIDLEEAAGPTPLPDGDTKRSTERKTSKKESQPKHDGSLIKALTHAYFWLWWTAGILTLLGST